MLRVAQRGGAPESGAPASLAVASLAVASRAVASGLVASGLAASAALVASALLVASAPQGSVPCCCVRGDLGVLSAHVWQARVDDAPGLRPAGPQRAGQTEQCGPHPGEAIQKPPWTLSAERPSRAAYPAGQTSQPCAKLFSIRRSGTSQRMATIAYTPIAIHGK